MAILDEAAIKRQLAQDLREGKPLQHWLGDAEHLAQWSFTPTFRLWLAAYLEAGHRIPDWLMSKDGEAKVAPALPVR